jgi:hypothetical protein
MKALVKTLIAIVLVLGIVFAVAGPGRVVAGAEYPFGIGPWSSTGRYCQNIYEMTHFADVWQHSDHTVLTPSQKVTWQHFKKTLTSTGPEVPRADFTAWYRSSGISTKHKSETALINTWWNQNCTDPMMEAPASINHVWSGVGSHLNFAHYPKNVIVLRNFLKVYMVT